MRVWPMVVWVAIRGFFPREDDLIRVWAGSEVRISCVPLRDPFATSRRLHWNCGANGICERATRRHARL
jgi:hypothetical protein